MSRIPLCKPAAGETTQFVVKHGCVYVLDFDTSSVTFSRDNGNLDMVFEDGSQLVLRDFYTETKVGDLFLELPDGAVVSARDVIQAMEFVPDNFPLGCQELSADAHAWPASPLQVADDDAAMRHDMLLDSLAVIYAAGDDTVHPYSHDLLSPQDALVSSLLGAGVTTGIQAGAPHHDAPPTEGVGSFHLQIVSDAALLRNPYLEIAPPESPAISPSPAAEDSPFGPHQANGDMAFSAGPRLMGAAANSADILDDGHADASLFFPGSGKDAELLVLEDLLDTSMPGLGANAGDNAPAFEHIFVPSPENVFMVRSDINAYSDMDNNIAGAESHTDGTDQLLLAFLRMGSF
jgi:hypothetical protein